MRVALARSTTAIQQAGRQAIRLAKAEEWKQSDADASSTHAALVEQ